MSLNSIFSQFFQRHLLLFYFYLVEENKKQVVNLSSCARWLIDFHFNVLKHCLTCWCQSDNVTRPSDLTILTLFVHALVLFVCLFVLAVTVRWKVIKKISTNRITSGRNVKVLKPFQKLWSSGVHPDQDMWSNGSQSQWLTCDQTVYGQVQLLRGQL